MKKIKNILIYRVIMIIISFIMILFNGIGAYVTHSIPFTIITLLWIGMSAYYVREYKKVKVDYYFWKKADEITKRYIEVIKSHDCKQCPVSNCMDRKEGTTPFIVDEDIEVLKTKKGEDHE